MKTLCYYSRYLKSHLTFKIWLIYSIFILNLLVIVSAYAVPLSASSQNQLPKKATLLSDTALVFYKQGSCIYEGNVHYRDEDSLLTGDKVVTFQDKKTHHFTAIIDNGNPAHYENTTDPKQPPLIADADLIQYFPLQHRIILKNHGSVRQGANHIEGPFIQYDTLKHTLYSQGSEGERVHIALENDGSIKLTS